MNACILTTISVIWYSFADAQNYTDAELTAALLKLGITSNDQCLQQAAYINAAIAAGNQSTLMNVPPVSISPENVNFVLFTRDNPTMPQNLSATDSSKLKNSNFDVKKLTFIFIHGSSDSYKGRASKIKDELLKCFNINVIINDWSSFSYYNLTYTRNVSTPLVGKICSQFIELLLENGVSVKQLLLAGHSTGAQAAGIAAKNVPGITKVIAIDPVGPCFSTQPTSSRIANTDAKCVEIMHCSVGNRGLTGVDGTLTFILNGGVYQPQCYGSDLDAVSLCSHNACLDYFVSSLKNGFQFVGIACQNLQEYSKCNCSYENRAILGFYASCLQTGNYFVDTCPYSHAKCQNLQWYY